MSVLLYQGLFRIAAGASKLKKLKAALDCSTSQLEEFYSDPHAVAGTVLSPTHVLYMFRQEFSSNMTVRPFLTSLSFHSRSPEVLPERTAGTSDELPALRRVDSGV